MWPSELHSGYPTQWALNPSAYQNVSNEEVDWAKLAQQWIKMKECYPLTQVPPAPPPPQIGAMPDVMKSGNESAKPPLPPSNLNDSFDTEGGEAPMEMDTKDDNDPIAGQPDSSGHARTDSNNWGSWNNWQQWSWNSSWPSTGDATVPGVQPPVPPPPNSISESTSVPPFPFPPAPPSGSVMNSSYSTVEGVTTFDYNHARSSTDQYNQGYWMGGTTPYIKQKDTDWRQDNHYSNKAGVRPDDNYNDDEEIVPVIDAAKRKQLPAWIREGLEKMEKEKLKKLEKERMQKEKEMELEKRKQMESMQQQQYEADPENYTVPHSKFDSDVEDSINEDQADDVEGSDNEEEEEDNYIESKDNRGLLKKSRFDQTGQRGTYYSSQPPAYHAQPPPPVYKTKDQIIQETMQKVRIVLTDILMCVTSEELEKAANETLISVRAKAPAKEIRKTPALTSLTHKLGLGIYDSDESEESDTSDQEDNYVKNIGMDSDEELKERVIRRKQEFSRIEGDIISTIEELEEKQRRHMVDDEQEEEEDDERDQMDKKNDHKREQSYERIRNNDEQIRQNSDEHQTKVEANQRKSGSKGNHHTSYTIVEENLEPVNAPNVDTDEKIISDDTNDSDDNNSSSSSSSSSRSNSSRSSCSSTSLKSNRDNYSNKKEEKRKRRDRDSPRKRSRSRSSSRNRTKDRRDSYRRKDRESKKDSKKNSVDSRISKVKKRKSEHSHEFSSSRDRSRSRDRRYRSRSRDRVRDRSRNRDRSRSKDRTRDRSRSRSRDRKNRHNRYEESPSSYRRSENSSRRSSKYSSSSHKKRRSRSSSGSPARSSSRKSDRSHYRY